MAPLFSTPSAAKALLAGTIPVETIVVAMAINQLRRVISVGFALLSDIAVCPGTLSVEDDMVDEGTKR